MSAHAPPAGAQSIDEILAEARSHLRRLSATQLLQQFQTAEPTYLIDIRPAAQRAEEGAFTLPDNVASENQIRIIERNVLEWRLDPQANSRLKDVVDPLGYETRVVVACSEGYTSSLAARELQRLGLRNATDLEGGYWAWKRLLDNTASSM